MKGIGDVTEDERKGLIEWVASGKSVHCNPGLVYGENGWPLDYISAVRAEDELYRDGNPWDCDGGEPMFAGRERIYRKPRRLQAGSKAVKPIALKLGAVSR